MKIVHLRKYIIKKYNFFSHVKTYTLKLKVLRIKFRVKIYERNLTSAGVSMFRQLWYWFNIRFRPSTFRTYLSPWKGIRTKYIIGNARFVGCREVSALWYVHCRINISLSLCFGLLNHKHYAGDSMTYFRKKKQLRLIYKSSITSRYQRRKIFCFQIIKVPCHSIWSSRYLFYVYNTSIIY